VTTRGRVWDSAEMNSETGLGSASSRACSTCGHGRRTDSLPARRGPVLSLKGRGAASGSRSNYPERPRKAGRDFWHRAALTRIGRRCGTIPAPGWIACRLSHAGRSDRRRGPEQGGDDYSRLALTSPRRALARFSGRPRRRRVSGAPFSSKNRTVSPRRAPRPA